ncbi:MAG: glycine cleavage system protein H [Deltaproteobacteria bacterium]|nr:glycine cleavage system protein H [Deltaproteobacteria bacterium]
MSTPSDLKYTKSHEWIRIEGDAVTVGITWFAQDSMGDVVHVELPEVGDSVDAGAAVVEIESVKAVSDVYSPVGGTIVEVNETLEDSPETVNSEPYGEGWLFKVKVGPTISLHELMGSGEYAEHCG